MRIELLSLTQTVLIIPSEVGCIYTNQVGGTQCDYPEQKGSIVPIEYDIELERPKNSLTLKICALFPEGSPGIIDLETAEIIQELLNASPYTSDIEVDFEKLNESKEAWLFVKVNGTLDDTISKCEKISAILTWPNSD